jgi:hypothetical protein
MSHHAWLLLRFHEAPDTGCEEEGTQGGLLSL